MKTSPVAQAVRVEVVGRGRIPARAKEYAVEKLSTVVDHAPQQVQRVHVVLTRTAHRAADEHVTVEANVSVAGHLVRAQVAAATSREAIDLACDRLRRKLSELRHRPGRPGGRHRSHRPAYPQMGLIEREVTRRKTFELMPQTIDEAIFELELMDRDFHIFLDASSNVESLLYRGDGGYRITRVDHRVGDISDAQTPVKVDNWPAPWLPERSAVGVMDICDAPFVFYVDPQTGRGRVMYRRYDGQYGLLEPVG